MNRVSRETVICVVLLVLVFGVSLTLRSSLPWNAAFGGYMVKMTDNDAYFYMRLLDNLCAHFPALGSSDPYFIFPAGRELSGQPMFMVYFMGFFAWLLGGGAPSQQTVDLAGAYFPAVLGALLVFPVFLIARKLYNKWAGLAAALAITLIPGEFLARTLLGNADTHAMEIFFSTLFMLFLLLGAEKGRELRLLPARGIEKRGLTIMLTWLALAGLCLGIYIASWAGAALFVLISLAWLALQFISDHQRKTDTLYLGLSGAVIYIVALAVSGPAANLLPLTRVALVIALLCAIALAALSIIFKRYGIKPACYIFALAGTAIAAAAVIVLINPDLAGQMFNYARAMFIWNPLSSIAESQPLLMQDNRFTLALVWGNYTAGSLLALAGFAAVCYRGVKEGRPGMLMTAVWTLMILLVTLAMRRFAYYLAINIAILSGVCCWLILQSCGFKATAAENEPAETFKKETRKRSRKGKRNISTTSANAGLMTVGALAALALTVYPNTGPLPGGDRPFFDVATRALYSPSDAWCESLDWLREKSPEPFGDSRYYYELYQGDNKQASYSALTWWDYGYWVTRIGHRVPVCNPGASLRGEEKYFTAREPDRAAALCDGWKTRYVIVDDYMVNWQRGFPSIAYAAGLNQSQYYEIYYRQQNDGLVQTLVYYPEYYNTMAVRLYCFEGRQYAPQETAVISWEPQTGKDGRPFKLITGVRTMGSYSDAQAFIAAQKTGNWRIVGKDPLASPVPLEALPEYSMVFSSSLTARVGNTDVPAVKIFEYNKDTGRHE